MAMTEQEWIARFTGGKGISHDALMDLPIETILRVRREAEIREHLALKQSYMSDALQQIEAVRKDLKAFSKTQLKLVGAMSRKIDIIGGGGDPEQSFGFVKDLEKLKKSPESMAELYRAQSKVIAIRDALQRHFPTFTVGLLGCQGNAQFIPLGFSSQCFFQLGKQVFVAVEIKDRIPLT